jgi:SAM-dependent methyltransferase
MAVIDGTGRARRIIQSVCDFRRNAIKGARIADLGCAHGQFALEFARRGADAFGIEPRDEWLRRANAQKTSLKLDSVSFIKDDVRNFTRNNYGQFDVVLCLGLLYHLDAPDVFECLANIYEACADFALIDTQISLRPAESREWCGRTYWGWSYEEHPLAASTEAKVAVLGASIDNERSFWLTRSSLLNCLQFVGFSSVVECCNPINSRHVDDGQMCLYADYPTFIAIKGTSVDSFVGLNSKFSNVEEWPEDIEPFLCPKPLSLA